MKSNKTLSQLLLLLPNLVFNSAMDSRQQAQILSIMQRMEIIVTQWNAQQSVLEQWSQLMEIQLILLHSLRFECTTALNTLMENKWTKWILYPLLETTNPTTISYSNSSICWNLVNSPLLSSNNWQTKWPRSDDHDHSKRSLNEEEAPLNSYPENHTDDWIILDFTYLFVNFALFSFVQIIMWSIYFVLFASLYPVS